ncbi:MAG TPA: DEAD/DEAH box helicase [Tepidisphaeraceae bacterium]|nr:DEAD/DEAH box helicase [Tepidisphaeraceae bacterium]
MATPIQEQAIPHALSGRDVLGSAQTGTGKTAAFALPILHKLASAAKPAGRSVVRCLVLAPTRELANQTAAAFKVYGKNLHLKYAVIYGGVGQNPQVQALRQGVDVLVATPGRLMDLMNQGHVDLRGVEVLVLDEADRMLDMGFINDIRKIVAKLPATRQTLFFSATMPPEIRSLADALLRDAVNIQVATVTTTAEGVEQSLYFVGRDDKASLLAHLYKSLPMYRSIVFTRTKRGADRVVKRLHAAGIHAEAIHGDKAQGARERALNNFRMNKTPILVATDIASRGIDVDGVTHVVNYDLTHEPETYIHRIGRTARAGASGVAVSFCDPEEVVNLKAIEKLIRRQIPVKSEHAFKSTAAAASAARTGGRPGHPGKFALPPQNGKPRHPAGDRGPRAAGERSHEHVERTSHSKTPHVAHVQEAKPQRGPARHPLAHETGRAPHSAGSRPHRPSQPGGGVPHARSGANRGRPASRRRTP